MRRFLAIGFTGPGREGREMLFGKAQIRKIRTILKQK